MVALGGVVVDDVQDDLDPGLVQRPDRRLELQHLLAAVAPGGVRVVRGEEADGVVAPVVAQAHVGQPVVLHELVYGHQLQGRDPELGQMVDERRMGERRVRAPQLLREPRVTHAQALDVGLVDHRVVVLGTRRPVVGPVEVGVDHHRRHGVRRRVQVVAAVRSAEVVAVHLLAPADRAADRLRVRVEQQLRGVAAQAASGVVRAVHPEPVALSGHHARHIRVPHERVALAQFHRRLRAVVVQQTQLYSVRGLREDREVGSGAVVGGAERIRLSRPDLHGYDSPRCAAALGPRWPPSLAESDGTSRVLRPSYPPTSAHGGSRTRRAPNQWGNTYPRESHGEQGEMCVSQCTAIWAS